MALGVAAACSDDSSSPGNNNPTPTGGEGGEGATTTTGGGGKGGKGGGGSGGTATTGGKQSSMGGASAGESGEAGMAGTPQMATLGEQCTTCGASECTDKLNSCKDGTECGAWLTCITACDTSECVSACDAKHEAAARVYSDVYDCLCTSCKDDCTGADACGKKTCTDENPLALMPTAPATLAETGLYELVDAAGGASGAGGASSELAMPIKISSQVHTFVPSYPLWADGATKQRYAYIPKCETIDTSDMDHWKFPVGTTFWKTFSVGDARVETRMMHRFGTGPLDWTYAAYQWPQDANATDPTLAVLASGAGVPNANGTTHDIPSEGQCLTCHNKMIDKPLGFGAIQLSHDAAAGDIAIKTISELGWLSVPAPNGFKVPGTPVQQAALGYMHGNCGGCHNEISPTPANAPQLLRLMVAETDYATSKPVTTTVNVPVLSGNAAFTGKDRIEPMEPDNSAILIRMKSRVAGVQMPPLGTKVADTDGGVKAVTDWVNSIPK
ncbi:MAG TPA: hypothetical protein VHB79_22320 [Polyangiaceae bacterium]|nr:hypothetical protein [Polyangiaceae bacterium]